MERHQFWAPQMSKIDMVTALKKFVIESGSLQESQWLKISEEVL